VTPAISLEDLLSEANTRVDNSQFDEARVLLNVILKNFPDQADALHSLGVIELKCENGNKARQLIAQALRKLAQLGDEQALKGVKSVFLAHYGKAEEVCGNLAAAIVAWLRSLECEENPEVRRWLVDAGVSARKLGLEINAKIESASSDFKNTGNSTVLALRSALERKKNQRQRSEGKAGEYQDVFLKIEALINKGGVENAKLVEPECRKLIKNNPKNFEPLHMLTVSLLYQRKYEEALQYARQAVQLADWNPLLYNTLGVIERRASSVDSAEFSFRTALRMKPDYAEAHQNLANLLRDEANYEEAKGWYLRALELKDNYAECWNNLGILHRSAGNPDEALICFEKSIAIEDHRASSYMNMGVIYEEKRNKEKAIECYKQVLIKNPQFPEIWPGLVHNQMHLLDWSNLERGTSVLKQLLKDDYLGELLPFNLLSLPSISALEQKKCGEIFGKFKFDHIKRQADQIKFHHQRRQKNKLNIGYLSADFRAHAVSVALTGVLEKHDKNRFNVFAYGYGKNDGSSWRNRVMNATVFRDVDQFTHLEAAERIHADEVDILIDLTGYTAHSRNEILALRPAPIQVNYLGYPSTMAVDFIDYIIGDKTLTPVEHASYYSEKLALLPDCYFPNDRQRKIGDPVDRISEGLPEHSFVFCSFNQPYKINPALLDSWCRILKQADNAVLWLPTFEPKGTENIKSHLKDRGVDPGRLVFAKVKSDLSDHLSRIRLADLALDTVPYNGHTTTSDALWSGVPVLTCLGEYFPSRVAASMLGASGLPELVAKSLEDYEDKALMLYKDRSVLAGIRQRLEETRLSCALFDTDRYVANLETLYLRMYEIWMSGNLPRHIDMDVI
jgi:protein O-GlcNAc transferase